MKVSGCVREEEGGDKVGVKVSGCEEREGERGVKVGVKVSGCERERGGKRAEKYIMCCESRTNGLSCLLCITSYHLDTDTAGVKTRYRISNL